MNNNFDSANENDQIKCLKINNLNKLANKVREEIIEYAKTNKIHLASNLSVVDIAVSLAYSFNFDKDQFFFDVGHQLIPQILLYKTKSDLSQITNYLTYNEKIFKNKQNDLFYFFGHCGASLGISQGYCENKNNDFYTINFIGDGSIANGMAFEALNNIANNQTKIIIILNDNGMSIDQTNGGLQKHLSTKKPKLFCNYFIHKFFLKKSKKNLIKLKMKIKNKFFSNNFFENLGFYYIGVINGHNIKHLIKAIEKAKSYSQFMPVIIHIKTKKGFGLEKIIGNDDNIFLNPKYHMYKIEESNSYTKKYSDIIDNYLSLKIESNNKIKIINPGMVFASGFQNLFNNYNSQTENVGICESLAIDKAVGSYLTNTKTIVMIYSTFLQRCYDQIINDISLLNCSVLFLIDRCELSENNGNTHHGIYDVGMIKSIPNNIIAMPSNEKELIWLLDLWFDNKIQKPFFIRYNNGEIKTNYQKDILINPFQWINLTNNKNAEIAIISYGEYLNKIFDRYFKYENVDIINAIFISGYDLKYVQKMLLKYKKIIFYERIYNYGTIYNDLKEFLVRNGIDIKLFCFNTNNIGCDKLENLNINQNMEIKNIKRFLK